MKKPLNIVTENLSRLLYPSRNSSHFAKIGTRTTGVFCLFGNINGRSTPSCGIVLFGRTARCDVATAAFASSRILAARAAGIYAAPLAADSTVVASGPMHVAGSTIEPVSAQGRRSVSAR
jgi:hypothetical protein